MQSPLTLPLSRPTQRGAEVGSQQRRRGSSSGTPSVRLATTGPRTGSTLPRDVARRTRRVRVRAWTQAPTRAKEGGAPDGPPLASVSRFGPPLPGPPSRASGSPRAPCLCGVCGLSPSPSPCSPVGLGPCSPLCPSSCSPLCSHCVSARARLSALCSPCVYSGRAALHDCTAPALGGSSLRTAIPSSSGRYPPTSVEDRLPSLR